MKPKIQIDEEIRDMTESEYDALVASGWTPHEDAEKTPPEPTPEPEPTLEEETPTE